MLNEEFPRNSNLLQMENPKEGPAPWLENDAIYTALNKMKDGKAAGVSGIVVEMLKASGEAGLELFIKLFNNIVKEEKVPSDWEMSIIINCFKGKGDAVEHGNFRGLKLLDHLMKVFERVIEKYIREAVNTDDMQFGFMPGKGTMDAIFITRIVQERFLAKKKDFYFTFVDLEKAFDRVPQQVITWSLRKVGLEEWIIWVVKAMYENAKNAVNINGTIGDPFPVKVGVHQGSVLSPLLFIIVLEALSREFRTGLPWELLYADNLNPQNKTGKFPCSVCLKGVGRNSNLCPACKCWLHAKCSGLKGQLAKATNFVCSQCSGGAGADRNNEEKVMLAASNLEVVDKFWVTC